MHGGPFLRAYRALEAAQRAGRFGPGAWGPSDGRLGNRRTIGLWFLRALMRAADYHASTAGNGVAPLKGGPNA